MFKDKLRHPDLPCKTPNTDLDALLLLRALRLQIGFVLIGALYTQEAVSCVANPTGQHTVPQHGVDHCAFTITGPENKQTTQLLAECETRCYLKASQKNQREKMPYFILLCYCNINMW